MGDNPSEEGRKAHPLEEFPSQRFMFLSEASKLLTSLDYKAVLPDLANLLVNGSRYRGAYLADWCAIDVVEEDQLRGIAFAGTPPLKERWGDNVASPFVCAARDRVLDTGKSELYSDIDEDGVKSAIFVPLRADDRILGTMTLLIAESGGHYGPSVLTLVEELANHIAIGIENCRLHRELKAQRDRIEEASIAKDEFLTMLSHELSNIVMPIIGFVGSLKRRTALMEDVLLREEILALERNAQQVSRLVRDCLDMTRIATGKMAIEKEVVDLNEIVRVSVTVVEDQAHAKGLSLFMMLPKSGPLIWADRTRLEQIVVNVLMNAVKYTDTGLIAVTVRIRDGEAEFQVRDTGIGISQEFLDKIFEPFHTGTNAWLARGAGLGMGLSIARHLTALHGGRIWAESGGDGKGSTFYLRLPLASTQDACRKVSTQLPYASEPEKPARLLVIDDVADILFMLKSEFEHRGYSVLTSRSGRTGLEIAKRELPDLIISDIKMPDFDGYQLIRDIRAVPELSETPVVALTGFGMKPDVDQALDLGYTAHLCKPIDVEQLVDLVQSLTAESRQRIASAG
ncbi:MAG TPA: ATP-binding protein [Blastocatellia bacterium]|jgi:signal transduction histidine kinase/ActR/RegA family two-component response regulator|nr:ATP-binding protein [Blastocatellia bacterium]